MKEIQILNNGDTLNAIRTKINENFALTKEGIEEGVADPLAKFGVNEGNETDGVADLLNIEEGTLSFKVGGEYPNLVTTSGDGVTTQIESINPLHLQNLADGEYTVVVNGSNSNITDAEFYSQLLEPENANNGDVWFNGENALQAKQTLSSVTKLEVNNNTNFRKIVNIGNKYVAVGDNRTVSKSDDGGVTWSTLQLNSFQTDGVPIGCEVFDNKFYIVGSDKTTQFIDQNWQVSQGGNIAATSTSLRFLKNVNGKLLIGTSDGYVLMSDNATSWGQMTVSLSIGIMDIVFADGLYYAFNAQGNIFTSANLSTWTKLDVTTSAVHTAVVQGNRIIGAGNSGRLSIYSIPEKTVTLVNTPTTEIIRDIKLLEDGTFILVGDKGVCLTGKDINNLTKLNTGTSAALNCTHNGFMAGASGTFFKLGTDNQWIPYPYIPVGEVTISGGEVTYFTTYPYNTNGLHEASSSSFGLLRTAAVVDELNCHCSDAVLTPANLYSLNNYRTMNTEYQVDEKVGCPYHHNLQLTCIQAGTTSNEGLNTRGSLEAGTTIEDGTVIWQVEQLGVAGGGLPMFAHIWSDHIYNDVSYLRADNFSWHSGGMYITAYDILEEQYNNEKSITKTEKGITYKLTPDNFKIADPSQEDAIRTLYETEGIAWFYILDTENKRFKLPRTKWGFVGVRDEVGKPVEAGLPNITGTFKTMVGTSGEQPTGVFNMTSSSYAVSSNVTNGQTIDFDASRSSSIYGNSDTVQPPAIQQYLYFYVGAYKRPETEVNLGQISEVLNDKVDKMDVDGQWKTLDVELISKFTTDMNVDIDLSEYIPNDGYNYEILLDAMGVTGATSGNYLSVVVKSSILMGDITLFRAITRTSSSAYGGGNGILPIGTDRKITITNFGNASSTASSSNNVKIRAYRRLGKNI